MKLADISVGMRLKDQRGHIVVITELVPNGFKWRADPPWREQIVRFETVDGGIAFAVQGDVFWEPA